jgi:hypothetical protein
MKVEKFCLVSIKRECSNRIHFAILSRIADTRYKRVKDGSGQETWNQRFNA